MHRYRSLAGMFWFAGCPECGGTRGAGRGAADNAGGFGSGFAAGIARRADSRFCICCKNGVVTLGGTRDNLVSKMLVMLSDSLLS